MGGRDHQDRDDASIVADILTVVFALVRGWTFLMGNTRPESFLRGLKFSDKKIRGFKFLGENLRCIKSISKFDEIYFEDIDPNI